MMVKNTELKKEFERKLARDEKFKSKPTQRLNLFYEHSPYKDNQQLFNQL